MAADRLEVLIDARLGNVEKLLAELNKRVDTAGEKAGKGFTSKFGAVFEKFARRGLIVGGVVKGLQLATAAFDYFGARADFNAAQATGGIKDVIKSAEAMKSAIAQVPFVGGVAVGIAGRLSGYDKAVAEMRERREQGQDAIRRQMSVMRIERVTAPGLGVAAEEALRGPTTETMRSKVALQLAELDQKMRERRIDEENRLANLEGGGGDDKIQLQVFDRGERLLRSSAERLIAAQFAAVGRGGIAGNYDPGLMSLSKSQAEMPTAEKTNSILEEIRDRLPGIGSIAN